MNEFMVTMCYLECLHINSEMIKSVFKIIYIYMMYCIVLYLSLVILAKELRKAVWYNVKILSLEVDD